MKIETILRRCFDCKIEKELDAFNRYEKLKFGRTYICKQCTSIRRKKRYRDNPLLSIQQTRARYNGLSVKEYQDILFMQNNKCDLCDLWIGMQIDIGKHIKCSHPDCNEPVFVLSGERNSCRNHVRVATPSRWADASTLTDKTIYCGNKVCAICREAKRFYKKLKKHREKCKHDDSYTMTWPSESQQCYACGKRRDEMPDWEEPKEFRYIGDENEIKILNDNWIHALRDSLKD